MLTVKQITEAAKKRGKQKLSDEGGLQLWISKTGSKTWRFMYRFGGKQRSMTIGAYPKVSITEARAARDDAKAVLRSGQDPQARREAIEQAKIVAIESTFGYIAEEFLQKKIREGNAEQTIYKKRSQLEHALPYLKDLPIDELKAPVVLPVLKRLEAREQYDTAIELRALIGAIARYAMSTGRAEIDPSIALRGALITPKEKHYPAIVDPKPFGALLRAIDIYQGAPETVLCLQLLSLVATRPGELRNATWEEFDLSEAVWSIPAGRMKMRKPHKVPLSKQALAILARVREIHRGGSYVFPGARSDKKPISENTLNCALQTMGYKDTHTSHGFRSAFSSITNESGLWHQDAIERQIAHEDKNKTRRAYHRAEYWDERVMLMAWWGNACDDMKAGRPIKNSRPKIAQQTHSEQTLNLREVVGRLQAELVGK